MLFRVFLCFGIITAATTCAFAGGVLVGTSSIINTLDYTDAFTLSDFGGLPDRDHGYPLSVVDYGVSGEAPNGIPGEGLAVESAYNGNPVSSWPDRAFKITADGPSTHPYFPGGSGTGSEAGMAACLDFHIQDFGFDYGLRDDFVIQFDAIQTNDRIDILIGDEIGVSESSCFSLLIRSSDFGEASVQMYQIGTGDTIWNTGLDTGIESYVAGSEQWHNYAARFNLTSRTVEVFIDEVSKGVINIDAASGGQLSGFQLSGAKVGIGYGGGIERNDFTHSMCWFDNIQVGSTEISHIPGDANNDGKVDGSDVTILAGNWQTGVDGTVEASWEMGDFNGDKKVDGSDVTILAGNWQHGVTAAASAVPEPATVALILMGVATLLLWRRS